MNVSSVGMSGVSFGKLRPSAIRKALDMAKYNPERLEEIKSLSDEQANNPYDIVGNFGKKSYNFVVLIPGESNGPKFSTLEDACEFTDRASRLNFWQ